MDARLEALPCTESNDLDLERDLDLLTSLSADTLVGCFLSNDGDRDLIIDLDFDLDLLRFASSGDLDFWSRFTDASEWWLSFFDKDREFRFGGVLERDLFLSLEPEWRFFFDLVTSLVLDLERFGSRERDFDRRISLDADLLRRLSRETDRR